MPAQHESRHDLPCRIAGRRVWVAGHRGMVGAAIVRRLAREDCTVITATSRELDLRRQTDTEEWIAANQPEIVFVAAAKVGGILANDTYPGQFLYDNLMIQTNIAEGLRRAGCIKAMFLGSSCIYPRLAPQPMREDVLLTGPLEKTNEWYAIAKITGLKLAQAYRREYGCDFVTLMPTNLYGPGDNYHRQNSHVVAALIRKVHEAKSEGRTAIELWGSGTPRREFLHVDDLADAAVHLMLHYSGAEPVNVGVGHDMTIRDLALAIGTALGWEGTVTHDLSKPDGTPQKLLDVSRLSELGWSARIPMADGLKDAYADFTARLARGEID